MSESLIRTGISLDQELLERFDKVFRQKGYGSRSEAIRDLVRDHFVEDDMPGVPTTSPAERRSSAN